jgi:tRNA(adenine34) deaminase
MNIYTDEYFMREALKEAERAYNKEEVPVGAVIVKNNVIIARGHNLTEQLIDVTAHAEMQAFTSAAENLGEKYLTECTLYTTLEPCVMCAGAAFWTQIGKVVYGAKDEKRGYTLTGLNLLHPKTKVVSGVMAEECSAILVDFFKHKVRGQN